MKRISFVRDILPHVVAVIIFAGVTILFFNPLFFDHKTLEQHDIEQYKAMSKAVRDYRQQTGEEALWSTSAFSGMPAYLINVQWSNPVLPKIKWALSLYLPHPVANLYWAFLSYYIMLLAFRIRPGLAIAGALAFGLSSYMIVGLSAGHNSRIGAIAYIPLVVAGMHLAFSGRRALGFGVTALGMGLHLIENHLQMTYYLALIVLAYGVMRLALCFRSGQWSSFFANVGSLIPAVALAVGVFIAPLWSIAEYSRYSIRGPSELASAGAPAATGLSKDYVFAYSNGIAEPMTLLTPNFYGGSSAHLLVEDPNSRVYRALSQSPDPALANRLVRYTSPYWGPQSLTSPYYAGAIVVFVFAIGALFAERKYVAWLLPLALLGVALSWGDHFSSFNDLMFDYFPGYSKFRSVTFALILPLFCMPLLGLLGLARLFATPLDKVVMRKLLYAFLATGGVCLALWVFSGLVDATRPDERQLPQWFLDALTADRRALLRSDALRSLLFISAFAAALFFALNKKISTFVFSAIFTLLVTTDLFAVDRRYFTSANYRRSYSGGEDFEPLPVDRAVLQDTGMYRVYNLQESWSQGARTAYFHRSINGYHGAKLRRYQEFYDSCLSRQVRALIDDARRGDVDFTRYGGLNMLNVRYIIFGEGESDFILNPTANGAAWLVKRVRQVSSPLDELQATCNVDTRAEAILDSSKFRLTTPIGYDSLDSIVLVEASPPRIRYTVSTAGGGLAVFSEIFYPVGWHAFVDDREIPILRVNYILRALQIPPGRHQVRFEFRPKPYFVGDRIEGACSWVLLLAVTLSMAWGVKDQLASR